MTFKRIPRLWVRLGAYLKVGLGLTCLEKHARKKSAILLGPLVNYNCKKVYNIGSQMQLWKELLSGTPQGM
jgi:hypothetical protein